MAHLPFIAGVGALFLLTQEPYATELYSIIAPVVVIALGSWFIAVSFMGVYNMTIDSIFLCFCVDQERAKNGEPASSSAELAELIASDGARGAILVRRQSSRRSSIGVPKEVTSTRHIDLIAKPTPGSANGNPF